MKLDGQTLRIEVKAEGAGPPLEIRLRRFLKGALRGYGLRAVSITTVKKAPEVPS